MRLFLRISCIGDHQWSSFRLFLMNNIISYCGFFWECRRKVRISRVLRSNQIDDCTTVGIECLLWGAIRSWQTHTYTEVAHCTSRTQTWKSKEVLPSLSMSWTRIHCNRRKAWSTDASVLNILSGNLACPLEQQAWARAYSWEAWCTTVDH